MISMPHWLHILAIASLIVALVSTLAMAVDVARHPQHMWIMNIVWPVSGLFASVAALWLYFAYGRLATDAKAQAAMERAADPPAKTQTPFAVMVAKGCLHCGSGCCLGDIMAEWIAFLVPAVAVWFGWTVLFDEKMFAVWGLDYVCAFVLGIAFQYLTIKPMRDLSPGAALIEALKADILSLSAWQIGMYGFMAFAQFYLFRRLLGLPLEVSTPEFWFMMQIAMLAGFATSYPVNWWLIRSGIKERM